MTTEPTLRETYKDACAALRDLAQLVVATDAAQYEMPSGASYGKGTEGEATGVANPTLDITLDPRRLGLSEEMRDLTGFLRVTAHSIRARQDRLDRALARWEGDSVKPAA